MGGRALRVGMAACAVVLGLGWSGQSRGDVTVDAPLTDGGVQSVELLFGIFPIGGSFTQTTTDFDVSASVFPFAPILFVDLSGMVFQIPALPADTAIVGATLSLDVRSTDGVLISVSGAPETSGTIDSSEFGTGTPVGAFTPSGTNPNTIDVTSFFTSPSSPPPFVFFELDPTGFSQDTTFTSPTLTLRLAAVPEPSSLALGLAGGAFAIVAAVRRRRPAAD